MKNIENILKDAGLEVTAEQLAAIDKEVKENYKTVTDYEKQKDKLSAAEDKVKTLTESLDKFKDVDADKLNGEIADLKKQLEEKDKTFASQIADRDFDDLVKDAIAEAKGRNPKAIKALLDVEALKASKNQKDDVAAALKKLAEAEDSKMLFGEDQPAPVGKVGAIGKVTGGTSGDAFLDSIRAAAGLSTQKSEGEK
jgi:uncharacterized linocin/CFP29 family protein